MMNEGVVKAGYADLIIVPPNVKYQERFLKAYRGQGRIRGVVEIGYSSFVPEIFEILN
jgi:hypothetical protein